MRKLYLVCTLTLASLAVSAQCFEQDFGDITISPPLPPAGYAPGTVVNMCFSLLDFTQDEAEWVHAIIPNFGPGYDVSTIVPGTPPTPCSTGAWAWYDSWTSCETPNTWGPGFSFDSGSGLDCGGTPNDGDPGNNFGDPGNCTRIFCWDITTNSTNTGCPELDFLVAVNVYGDAATGSYGVSSICDDPAFCWPEPTVFDAMVDEPCPGDPFTLTGIADGLDCSGSVQWTGPGGFSSTDLITTATAEGVYTLILDRGPDCDALEAEVSAFYGAFNPTLSPSPAQDYCFGETVTLTVTGGDNYIFFDPFGIVVQQGTNNVYTFTATDMTAGTYLVQVNGTSATCVANLLTDINVFPSLDVMTVANPDPVCSGDLITFSVTNVDPTFTYEWDGGQGAGPSYSITATTPGIFNMTLEACNLGGCCETFDIPYQVLSLPVPNLSADPLAVCEGDLVTLTAEGGGTYDWSPTGDTGPNITDNPTTTTTYTVTVTSPDGCVNDESVTIDVQPDLAAPQISCESNTAATLSFDWLPVPGADFYEVFIDGVSQGTVTAPPFDLDGLDPLQEVTIRVVPFSNNNTNCPGMEAELTCQVRDCDPVNLIIDPIDPICADGSNDIIQLVAGAPGAGPGQITWSGPGVINPNNPGQVFLSSLGPGTFTYTATFSLFDGSCPQPETIDVVVLEGASAALDASDTDVCIDQTVTVELADAEVFGATYTWDFDGATEVSGSGSGPYELSFPTSGDYTISLQTQNGDCTDDGEITIQVSDTLVAPDVFCQAVTNSSVTFGWTDVGADSYTVVVVDGPSGTQTGNSYEVTGLNNGDEVTIQVVANSSGVCPSVTSAEQTCQAIACPDVMISIDNAPQTFCNDGNNAPINLTATVSGATNPSAITFAGPGVTGDVFDPDDAGLGMHTITATVEDEGCPFTASVVMEVLALPTSDFELAPDTVCIDQAVTVTYTGDADPASSTFNWDFDGADTISGSGGGPYEISWPTAGSYQVSLTVEDGNGCVSELSTLPAEVQNPLPAPVINCTNLDLDEVTFSWDPVPGATGYDIVVVSGPMGTENGTSYTVTGLNEGDEVTIEVTALGDLPCGNSTAASQTCQAQSCPDLVVVPTVSDTSFCLDDGSDPVLLTADVLNAAGTGTLTWSGPGVVEDAGEFFFDQQLAGLGLHTLMVSFDEAGCSVQTSVDLSVNPIPDASILDQDDLDFGFACEGESFIINYEGTADASAIFAWDFGGADVVTAQADFETYELTFDTPGLYEINLTVTQDGCTGVSLPYTIFVVPPLGSVDLDCGVIDLNSIEFSWAAILEAAAYELVLDGVVIDTTTDLSLLVDGLAPQTTVTLTVTPLSSDYPCGDGSPATVSCTTVECPDLMADFSANPPQLCIDAQPIMLMVDILNGSFVDSSIVWSGDGVVGNVFDPSLAGIGVHQINMDYSEDGPCTLSESFEITVLPLPDPAFMASALEVCVGDEIVFEYNGDADAMATYDWDFDAPATVSGSGQGPYQVSWDSPGTRTVSLQVTADGCTGTIQTVEIEVIAPLADPVISCIDTGLEEVTFSWDAIAGATGYEIVEIANGNTSTQGGTTYTITDLTPDQSVTISVRALGDPPCGDGEAVEATCSTLPCPDIVVNPITAPQSFCLADNDGPVLLEASSSGGDMSGTFSWSGQGVVQVADEFFFDPDLAGLGTWTLTIDYVETAGCTGSGSLEMSVVPVPTADFMLSADPICIGEEVTVTYTGIAGPNADYDWDFGVGNAAGSGAGPYTLDFGQAGVQTIGLQVTEGGCGSDTTIDLTVIAPLDNPEPSCSGSSLTSVTISWPAIDGATGYLITTSEGDNEVVTNTMYELTGLDPGQEVTFTVVAQGPPPCGDSEPVSVSCFAESCPDLTIIPTADQVNFCAGSTDQQQLMATITGGTGGEVATWSGTGVISSGPNFFFDPTGLPAGDYVLMASYNEGGVCPYEAELTMTIDPQPVADFEISVDVLCVDNTTIVDLSGVVAAGAAIDWDFSGATVTELGNERYELTYPAPGTYPINLVIDQNGCTDEAEQSVTVEQSPDPGFQSLSLERCPDDTSPSNLFDLLSGADSGGSWSAEPGTPPASVDPVSGQLDATVLEPGTYFYSYTLTSSVCGEVRTEVSITIQPTPVADAGENQLLTCTMGMVSLDGSGSDSGPGFLYQWTHENGDVMIDNPNGLLTDVSQGGIYTLEVTSPLGCTATDQVFVDANTEVPVPDVDLSNITCFAQDDGVIQVREVLGGTPPFSYMLNGQPMDNSGFYGGLEPGEYVLRVTGSNGCFSELFLDLSEPDELRVSLALNTDSTLVEQGDQVTVVASITGGSTVDTLIWEPDSLARAGEGNSITFIADETTRIRLRVIDELGCIADDDLLIVVRKDRPIFIPTGISPNNDNTNDQFLIYANPDEVEEIESFLIFNRWGETVFENYGFQPNDPAQGWDGTHRGQVLNPAVFVYQAVVRFADGESVLYSGDVTLVR
ncbi:MAG: gliding motility-associated C-terminal domain-containing protein [Bacteroidota bacterium]